MELASSAFDTVIVEDDDACRSLLDKFPCVRGLVTGCAASLAEARPMLGEDCKRVILDLRIQPADQGGGDDGCSGPAADGRGFAASA